MELLSRSKLGFYKTESTIITRRSSIFKSMIYRPSLKPNVVPKICPALHNTEIRWCQFMQTWMENGAIKEFPKFRREKVLGANLLSTETNAEIGFIALIAK